MCKHDFIFTRNNEDYIIKKKILEEELCKYVDDCLEKDEDKCWIMVMNREALLLTPNSSPIFCPAEICGAAICRYCYKNEHVNCPVCNNTN
jgi:hypothetical protein